MLEHSFESENKVPDYNDLDDQHDNLGDRRMSIYLENLQNYRIGLSDVTENVHPSIEAAITKTQLLPQASGR